MIWQRTHWRATLAALVLLGAAGVGALFAVTARADTFPGNFYVPLAQATSFTYCFDSTYTTSASVGVYAMGNLDSQTDMYDTYLGTCSPSIWYADAWWKEKDGGGQYLGYRLCIIKVDSSVCDSADIVQDFDELDTCGDWNDEMRKHNAAQELGHSVGLDHDSGDDYAMTSGCIPDADAHHRQYNSHDVSHIDTQY